MDNIILHPFKMGIRSILAQHFSPDIVNRFGLEFEVDLFIPEHKHTQGLINQSRDNNLILEVKYMNPDGTAEFICDVYSWESRTQTEVKLLQHITDKYKIGKIGLDWSSDKDKLVINPEIEKGVYATPANEPPAGNPNPTGRVHGRGKPNRKARS